jgi:NitT/TauT family transport system permease protein
MGILAVFLVWWLSTASGSVDKLFLPSPGTVWDAGASQFQRGILVGDAIASIRRVFLGFVISAGLALPIGIAMGTNRVICLLLVPLMALIRYMPAPAFIPLLIIYFGLEELPKVMLIFIGTFFFNALMIMDAVKFVPHELVETALMLGGRGLPILTRVVAPYIAPQVLDTYRIIMASAWNLVIVAELVAATEGLGKRISLAQRFLYADEIFVGLIVIGLIGLMIDLGFWFLMRRACSWAN